MFCDERFKLSFLSNVLDTLQISNSPLKSKSLERNCIIKTHVLNRHESLFKCVLSFVSQFENKHFFRGSFGHSV